MEFHVLKASKGKGTDILTVASFTVWGTILTCQHVEAAPRPLVSIYAVGVYVPNQDPIVVVVKIVPTQHIEFPLDGSHGVIHSPLQHRATA